MADLVRAVCRTINISVLCNSYWGILNFKIACWFGWTYKMEMFDSSIMARPLATCASYQAQNFRTD